MEALPIAALSEKDGMEISRAEDVLPPPLPSLGHGLSSSQIAKSSTNMSPYSP